MVLLPVFRGLAVTFALALGALVSIPTPAQALPAFAKAYGVSCSVCHTIPPQLNSYGRYLQRTGYASMDRDMLRKGTPVSLSIEPSYDSQDPSAPHRIQSGNIALHATGFIDANTTYHIHQWVTQHDQAGGTDVFQVAYSKLLKNNGHLFIGKISAMPVPGPYVNPSDVSGYASASYAVGEHMYQQDMTRWGTALTYAHSSFFGEIAWFGSNGNIDAANDFSSNIDKTFSWMASYADATKPLEAGLFGTTGSFPLSEGGNDRYSTVAAYVQRDPQNHMPGLLAVYQWGHDGNPGTMGPIMANGAAESRAATIELWQPFWENRASIGLRNEHIIDGLGMSSTTQDINFALQPFARYENLHIYLETGIMQQSTPAWRARLWWAVPLGK